MRNSKHQALPRGKQVFPVLANWISSSWTQAECTKKKNWRKWKKMAEKTCRVEDAFLHPLNAAARSPARWLCTQSCHAAAEEGSPVGNQTDNALPTNSLRKMYFIYALPKTLLDEQHPRKDILNLWISPVAVPSAKGDESCPDQRWHRWFIRTTLAHFWHSSALCFHDPHLFCGWIYSQGNLQHPPPSTNPG